MSTSIGDAVERVMRGVEHAMRRTQAARQAFESVAPGVRADVYVERGTVFVNCDGVSFAKTLQRRGAIEKAMNNGETRGMRVVFVRTR